MDIHCRYESETVVIGDTGVAEKLPFPSQGSHLIGRQR
jgi:hypothetical protein